MKATFYLYNTELEAYLLPPSACKVYHVLASLADNQTRTSFPSMALLSQKASVSLSSVSRAVKALVKAGLLQVKPRYRKIDGKRSSNLYTLTDCPNAEAMQVPSVKKQRCLAAANHQLASSPMSGHLIRLYCYLKSHSNREGYCCTTLRRIALKFGKSTRTIQRHIKKLLEMGLLAIIPSSGDRNTYVIKSLSNRRTGPKNGIKARNKKAVVLAADHDDAAAFNQTLTAKLWNAIERILFLRI